MNKEHPVKFERVMIIDDTPIDLFIAAHLIMRDNFGGKVLQYSNGLEAIKYLQTNVDNFHLLPNLIFVDIYMPIMNGFQFLEAYEQLPSKLKDHCKVFVVSSTSDSFDIERVRNDKNVVGFKEKPITMDFLASILV